MSDKTIDEETVRREHLEEVNEMAHWAYLVGVLAGGTLIMLVLIALLGSTGS